MVKLVVYGSEKATCSQRVLILLEELELKYSFKNLDLKKGEQKAQEYLEKHPFGKVPFVEYGSHNIFESRSILRYVSKMNRDEDNETSDLYDDVNVDVWLEVESQYYNPLVSKIVYERMWKDGTPDEKIINDAIKELEKVLDVYEGQLSKNEYISGSSFSIADISNIPYTYYMLKCGYKELYKSRPHVYNWLKKMMRRESVRRVLEGTVYKELEEN